MNYVNIRSMLLYSGIFIRQIIYYTNFNRGLANNPGGFNHNDQPNYSFILFYGFYLSWIYPVQYLTH